MVVRVRIFTSRGRSTARYIVWSVMAMMDDGCMAMSDDFGQKPWTIIRRFYRNRGGLLQSFYSTVEGAMEPKFASFCSS